MKNILIILIALFGFAFNANAYKCSCTKQIVGGGTYVYEWEAESEADCCNNNGPAGTRSEFDVHGSHVGTQSATNQEILNACCQFGGQ